MSQMIIFLILIFVSTFVLSAENPSRIKCSIQGPEEKVYYFDTKTKRYQLSVNEKGRQKTSLTRQIQHQVDRSQESAKNKLSFSFQIDDRTEVIVDMDAATRHGTGQINLKSQGASKKFDECKFVTSLNEDAI